MPKTTPPLQLRSADGRIELGTFLSLATQREYIDRRTGERWPAKMIDTIFAPIVPLDANGNPLRTANKKVEKLRASEWLDRYPRVDQQVWAPGEPEIILDRVLRRVLTFGIVVDHDDQLLDARDGRELAQHMA